MSELRRIPLGYGLTYARWIAINPRAILKIESMGDDSCEITTVIKDIYKNREVHRVPISIERLSKLLVSGQTLALAEDPMHKDLRYNSDAINDQTN